MKYKSSATRLSLAILLVLTLTLAPHKVNASSPASARTYLNRSSGDVFLGGKYIELGISKYGFLGSIGDKPDSFYGTSGIGEDNRIALASNLTGFGNSPDLRIDYILPGSPEHRWSVGYTVGGVQHFASNSLNAAEDGDGPDVGISKMKLSPQSSGTKLAAKNQGTYDNHVNVTQLISFNANDRFFKTKVTLRNVSGQTINAVRYMNSLDPDNTVFQFRGGDGEPFITHNAIINTFDAGDDVAAVQADSSNNNLDYIYVLKHTRSPIILVSGDNRARANSYGFSDTNPYDDDAYDNAPAKGYNYDDDNAIGIAFDVGSLAPGASTSFTFYTSIDYRGGNAAINMIRCGLINCAPGTPFPN
ncbi:MAG: hypothetical protein ACXWLH_01005 [Candidatus Saccharimonadales bacterium]